MAPRHDSPSSTKSSPVSRVLSGYHHVSLSVRDLDASSEWYVRVLGLEPLFDETGEGRRGRVFRLPGTSSMLGLTEHRDNSGNAFEPASTGLDHVAFAVPTRGGIDEWVTRLDSFGVTHSGPIDIPVGAMLNLSDPDGVQLSIFFEEV